MDNSRSLEALYQDGTGMVSLPKKSFKASIEGYDGFDDMLSVDVARSEENLKFLDTYQMIEAKNAADKVKMCKKIAANYGKRSGIPLGAAAGVESLCHMMSLEGEATAEAVGVDTGDEKAKTPETTEKKGKFFKTIFGAIRSFFEKIWSFFVGLVQKIGSVFKKKDKAGKSETQTGPDTVDMNINKTADGKNAAGADNNPSAMSSRSAGSNLNLDYDVFVDISKFNPAGVKKFSEKYQATAKSVKAFAANLKKAETVKNKSNGKPAEDASVAAGRRNALMENEGKKLIEAIDATSAIVAGVADRRQTLGARGDAKSIKAALDAANKDLKFEAGSENAYTVLQSLFGVVRDKQLETGITELKKSGGKKSNNYVAIAEKRKVEMAGYIAKEITNIPKAMQPSHDTMVQICKEYETNVNNYINGLNDNKSASEYYTSLTVMTSALKVCTKMEQVVVKAVSAMLKLIK